MGRPFQEEIDYLPRAIYWACSQDVKLLQRAALQFSGRGLFLIGSGGSTTAAAFAAKLHATRFSRIATAITPLDCFGWPMNMGAASAAVLISAEGKNKDILAAAHEIAARRMPAVALMLTSKNPLNDYCERTGAATAISYDMPWGKDGYLATNSLVALLVLLMRAFSLEEAQPPAYSELLSWFDDLRARLQLQDKVWMRDKLLVLHGEVGGVGAIDLESKLAESAFGFAQVSNFRQFAHGRHLQLARSDHDFSTLAFVRQDDLLASNTLALLPPKANVLRIDLPDMPAAFQELASVLAAMAVVEALAKWLQFDPGQPTVPQFGRDLHSMEVSELARQSGINSRMGPILAKWPDACAAELQSRTRSALDFIERLQQARFKAIVCDFDGTFCDTVRRFSGLDPSLVPELHRILEAGVRIGFATGRGDSLIGVLQKHLEGHLWRLITLGCYSGSPIFSLDSPPADFPPADKRLQELATWLRDKGVIGAQIEVKIDCGQMGLRAMPARTRERVKVAVACWLVDKQVHGWRVLSSGHSVDVLTEAADKRFVVKELAVLTNADPIAEILRIGDAGDLGGNDYELLGEGFSLSVDRCSPHTDCCWDLLPADRTGVQGTLAYLQALECEGGTARFTSKFLSTARSLVGTSSLPLDR